MELSAFAEQVLLGPTLADKLLHVDAITDTCPTWSGALPDAPGRVPELGLAKGRVPGTPLRVPDDAWERGALLHAFANHELLAIELLANALLRFSDAPAAFRRGLLQTLREEQTHLRLYIERMRSLGVVFGDQPLSAFFWRAMSGLETPEAFVAHLSLTFEQANLDFALHYQREFAALGDHETAAVLQTVLDDEVGHVALGLRWFERWRDPAVPLFEAHRDALVPPLQIVRAKAAAFEDAPRVRAGLPQAYIDRLRTCGGSRGRPARVWWFNGAAELEAEQGLRFTPQASTLATLRDLETVPAVLASEADVVLVRREPSPTFLARLAQAGLVLPRFVEADLERSPWPAPSSLGAVQQMCPWGASPRAHAFGATARVRAQAEQPTLMWSEGVRALYDKRTAVRLSASLEREPWWCDEALSPRVAEDWGAVEAARQAFAALGHRTRVKPVFGASGRGQCVLRDGEADRTSVEGLLRRGGAVVVEPEFEVAAQLSIRLWVDGERARVLGVGRCGSTARGQFDHAVLGPADVELPAALRRWFRGEGKDPKRIARAASAVAAAVGPAAIAAEYRGPVGVDALVVHTADGVRLRPLVDLNPRYTMGFVADALRTRVSTRARAVLRVTTASDVRALGYAGFDAWAEATAEPHFEGAQRRIASGVVHLTDPARAEALVVSLSVAPTVGEALDAVRVSPPSANDQPEKHSAGP